MIYGQGDANKSNDVEIVDTKIYGPKIQIKVLANNSPIPPKRGPSFALVH